MTDRAASEVLSFTLVFSLVIASVGIISVAGMANLSDARDAEQVNNAERAFDVLVDNVADIHRGGAPSRATEIDVGSAGLYAGENVTVNVTVVRSSGATASFVRQVRPLVYRGPDDQQIVYEAGAVFRTGRGGGLVRTPPPVVVRPDRVLLPILATQSPNVTGVSGSTVLVRTISENRTLAVSDDDGSYRDVYVNVTSPRRAQWAVALGEAGLTAVERGTDADGEAFVTYRLGSSPRHFRVTVHEIRLDIEQ